MRFPRVRDIPLSNVLFPCGLSNGEEGMGQIQFRQQKRNTRLTAHEGIVPQKGGPFTADI
jgi:hypothetical protein